MAVPNAFTKDAAMAYTPTQLLYVGIAGVVIALDRSTGAEVWRTKLKGGDFVNVLLDGPDLLATTKGEIFCLNPRDGQIKWNNRLKGLGFGLVSVAGSDSSAAMIAEYRRRQEAARSAASSAAIT